MKLKEECKYAQFGVRYVKITLAVILTLKLATLFYIPDTFFKPALVLLFLAFFGLMIKPQLPFFRNTTFKKHKATKTKL